MPNWIVQDQQTNQSWDLSVNGGQFYLGLDISNNSPMRNPIIQDSLLFGVYYQVSVISGELTYNLISASSADTVYMLDDTIPNQYWVIVITEGMFGIMSSSAPIGGSHGFYPIEYYHRWLKGGKQVKYQIKVNAQKSYSSKADLKVSGRKLLPKKEKGLAYANKKLSTYVTNIVNGRKVYRDTIKGVTNGLKAIPTKENVSVIAKKNLSPILVALDII